MSEKEEVIPALVWREKTTKAILNSVEVAIKVSKIGFQSSPKTIRG